MYLLISISAAVAPALILLRYYYRKDAARREPKGLIVSVFLWGVLSTIPATILEIVISAFQNLIALRPIYGHLFTAFIVAGFCEEYFKLAVVKRFAYRRGAFDEVMDGIVYTIVASLGFACIENVLFVIGAGMQVALVRAFTSVPMHAFCSGIMGYFVGRAKFAVTPAAEKRLFRTGLFIGILIHGIYDFLIFAHEELGSLTAPALILLLISTSLILRSLIRRALREDADAGRN